jgi:hypothetical protein
MPKYTIDQLSERVPKLNKDQSGLTLHQLWLRNPDTLNGGILYYLDIYLFKPYYKSLDDFGNKTTYYPAVYSGYINDELIQFLSLECRFSFGALHFHYGITPPRIRN